MNDFTIEMYLNQEKSDYELLGINIKFTYRIGIM